MTLATRSIALWLELRGLRPEPPDWCVSIELDDDDTAPTTRLRIRIAPAEWSFRFERAARHSSVRVTDLARAIERDDFGLAPATPDLNNLAQLVTALEHRFEICFRRLHAVIETNLPRAEPTIRLWVVAAL